MVHVSSSAPTRDGTDDRWDDGSGNLTEVLRVTLPPLESGGNSGYALLEVACVVAFLLASVLAARHWAHSSKVASNASHSVVDAGVRLRRRLLGSLVFASAARCVALLMSAAMLEGLQLPGLEEDGPHRRWVLDLLDLVPSLFFLSAFSVVVFFWAQLHYKINMVSPAYLECVFISINLSCYIVMLAIVATTLVLQAYDHLRSYLFCLIGVLSIALGLAIAFYSCQVYSELAASARKKLPWRRPIPRVVALGVVAPCALLLRGFWFLAWDMAVIRPSLAVHLLLVMLCEWLPLVVATMVLGPAPHGEVEDDDDDDSDFSDGAQPLLVSPHSHLFTSEGSTWKQLHPQPTP